MRLLYDIYGFLWDVFVMIPILVRALVLLTLVFIIIKLILSTLLFLLVKVFYYVAIAMLWCNQKISNVISKVFNKEVLLLDSFLGFALTQIEHINLKSKSFKPKRILFRIANIAYFLSFCILIMSLLHILDHTRINSWMSAVSKTYQSVENRITYDIGIYPQPVFKTEDKTDASSIASDSKQAATQTSIPFQLFDEKGFVFSKSDMQLLTQDEIENVLKEQKTYDEKTALQFMINEIYARHGLEFQKDPNKSHYSQYEWYNSINHYNVDEVSSMLNSIEKQNVEILANIREKIR